MLLSGERIRELVNQRKISIDPFNEGYLEAISYELHLGSELLKLSEGQTIRPKIDTPVYDRVVIQEEGYILQPQEFILGETEEQIGITEGYAGLLDGKTGIAKLGVSVFQASYLCDPGRSNRLTLEIFNAGPRKIILSPQMPIASLSFVKVV